MKKNHPLLNAKPFLQSNHTLSNIKLIQEVQNSNYCTLMLLNHYTLQTTKKDFVNIEPGIFNNTPFLYV